MAGCLGQGRGQYMGEGRKVVKGCRMTIKHFVLKGLCSIMKWLVLCKNVNFISSSVVQINSGMTHIYLNLKTYFYSW